MSIIDRVVGARAFGMQVPAARRRRHVQGDAPPISKFTALQRTGCHFTACCRRGCISAGAKGSAEIAGLARLRLPLRRCRVQLRSGWAEVHDGAAELAKCVRGVKVAATMFHVMVASVKGLAWGVGAQGFAV